MPDLRLTTYWLFSAVRCTKVSIAHPGQALALLVLRLRASRGLFSTLGQLMTQRSISSGSDPVRNGLCNSHPTRFARLP